MSRVGPIKQCFNDKKAEKFELKAENTYPDKNDSLEVKVLLLCLRHKKICLWVQSVLKVIYMFAFVFSIKGKLVLYSQVKGFDDVIAVINILSDFLLLVVNILAMIDLTKASFFVELFTFVLRKRTAPVNQQSIGLIKYVQILRFLPLIPIVTSSYFIVVQLGWSIKLYFLPRDIWYYILNLIGCSAIILASKIKETFSAINEDLEQLCKNDAISFIAVEVPVELRIKADRPLKIRSKLEILMDLTNDYTILCNLLDKFNSLMKGQVLLVVVCITINILLNVALLVKFTVLPNMATTGVLVSQIMLAGASMSQAAGAAFVGEMLEEEGEKTSRICYTLLNKLNRKNAKTDCDEKLIDEVKLLLDQSKSRKICLHAGGFFKLNWGILGSIISAVATYSIVIIQFLLK